MFVIVAFSKVAGADFSFSHSGSVKKEAQKLPRVFLKHRKVTYSSWACSSHRRLQAKWIWQLSLSIARKTWPSLHLRVWFAPTRSFAFSLRPLVMEPSSGFYWDPVLVLDFKGWGPIQGDGWDIHGVCLLYQENLVKIQENINNLGLKFLKPSTFHCC